jgi:hypothetical protein
MADDVIHARYRWTSDEALRAQHFHTRHTLTRYYRPVLLLLASFAVTVGLLAMANACVERGPEPRDTSGEFLAAAFMIFGGLMPFAMPNVRRWRARRQFAMRPDRDCEVEWTIDANEITLQTPQSRATSTWQTIMKIVKAPEGFVIYKGPRMFQWLPRHAFASDADYQRFASLARERVTKYYDES